MPNEQPQRPLTFAVAASFTAEPIAAALQFWGKQLEASIEPRFAPYNQLVQTLVYPGSVFGQNRAGVNVLLARVEDLAHLDPNDPESDAQAVENAGHLAEAIRESAHRFAVPLIVSVTPPSPPVAESFAETCSAATKKIEAALDGVPGVQYLSSDQVARLYPVESVYDPAADRLGHIPYTEPYFVALGTAIVRLAHALAAPPYKVIALDCDNTLWQGICGEDGPRGVVLDAPRRALHNFMLEQREAGMLLAIASKNNEPDVAETFELNPEFPLQLRHFAAQRVNWESKAENLASLASELSLGLDSFIFIDDNPRECAEVEEASPEVLTLALPEDSAVIPAFLDHIWAFDHPVVTEEDRNRNAYYAQARAFGAELKRAGTLENFIGNLGLQLSIQPLAPETLSRAAQMTQRTNQFNFTTIRRTESELTALIDGGARAFTVDASDRFGKYGIVGLLIWRESPKALEIDTLLLSCRALGRGVEHRMLSFAAKSAVDDGIATLLIRAIPTRKNQPARQFLHDVARRYEQSRPDSLVYPVPAAEFVDIAWKPAAPPPPPQAPAPAAPKSAERKFVPYAHIARALSTATDILAAMRSTETAGAGATTEERLAAIWSDLLHRSPIRPQDNFYDLGGHSLLAVLLTLRVREEFGVELPIDDVYSANLTLAELARKVDLYLSGGHIEPADYEALLREIESMSDDEVRLALEREAAEEPA